MVDDEDDVCDASNIRLKVELFWPPQANAKSIPYTAFLPYVPTYTATSLIFSAQTKYLLDAWAGKL